MRGPRPDRGRSFWEADLEGSNLAGMTIASDENAFQRASFRDCRLEARRWKGATPPSSSPVSTPRSSPGARLKGGGSSFQVSSFVGADLTGATLPGGRFVPGRVVRGGDPARRSVGDFQGVNISGARFEAADLSAIGGDDLASCYFKEPPTYDARKRSSRRASTPSERSWRRLNPTPTGDHGWLGDKSPASTRETTMGRLGASGSDFGSLCVVFRGKAPRLVSVSPRRTVPRASYACKATSASPHPERAGRGCPVPGPRGFAVDRPRPSGGGPGWKGAGHPAKGRTFPSRKIGIGAAAGGLDLVAGAEARAAGRSWPPRRRGSRRRWPGPSRGVGRCRGRCPPGNPPPASSTAIDRAQWSRPAVGVDLRRPAELAGADDDRLVQQARERPGRRSGPRAPGPAAAAGGRGGSRKLSPCVSQPPKPERHEPGPGLDQPPGRQRALAERRPAVVVAERVRLARQVEGLPDRSERRISSGLVVEAVEARHTSGGVERPKAAVEPVAERVAGLEVARA